MVNIHLGGGVAVGTRGGPRGGAGGEQGDSGGGASVFRLSALFGSQMRERGRGAIVNISSTGSLRPEPFFAPYAAAKAGVNTLTECFAKELGPKVRVNTVMPGPFHTDATVTWSRSE